MEEDWDAISLVLGGAIVNYWLAADALREAPKRIDEERFIDGWTRLAMALIGEPARAM